MKHAKELLLLNGHRVPRIDKELQPFAGNGNVSIWVKILDWDEKTYTNVCIFNLKRAFFPPIQESEAGQILTDCVHALFTTESSWCD